jgi:hypothetical protein
MIRIFNIITFPIKRIKNVTFLFFSTKLQDEARPQFAHGIEEDAGSVWFVYETTGGCSSSPISAYPSPLGLNTPSTCPHRSDCGIWPAIYPNSDRNEAD